MPRIDLPSLSGMVQQYISRKYAAALIDRTKVAELKAYIAQYLYDTGFTVDGYTEKTLAERLYSEMAEYSVLTRYLDDPDVEEINVGGWDDIAITHLDGRIEKNKEHFFSPQHAEDVVKKLLQHSGMIIDNASPLAQGHLPNNTRITAVKKPVVDEERAIAVSIRKLYPQRVDRDNLIRTNTLTEEMLGFLETCIRYGVSFVVAGRTSSGKTTLLNALLAGIPDNKRIYTIESGARELSLVKRNGAGEVINNVVHTISRPSDNEAYTSRRHNCLWRHSVSTRTLSVSEKCATGKHTVPLKPALPTIRWYLPFTAGAGVLRIAESLHLPIRTLRSSRCNRRRLPFRSLSLRTSWRITPVR